MSVALPLPGHCSYNLMVIDRTKVEQRDLWYVIGLIATDGNLSKDGRHINITSKDVDHLEKVKVALLINNKISMKGNGTCKDKIYGFLQFSDAVFYRYLLSIGIMTRKSLRLQKIIVPNKQFRHFLRGVIDGDGNIHKWIHPQNHVEQWELRIYSASPLFINWLYAETCRMFGVKGIVVTNKSKRMFVIKFGKMAARVILRECYKKNWLALERKYILAKSCISSYKGWSRSLTINRPK